MPFATFPQNLKQQQDEENSHRRDGGHSPHSRNDGNNYINGHFKSILMTLDDFIRNTYKDDEYLMRPAIICKDGFKMSVQGSSFHYCSPRKASDSYYEMEIGYPTAEEIELLEYAEDKNALTNTVYGYVPTSLIQSVIEKHGGIDVTATFQKKTV
jgi:hypothetical protein